jgi:hypothetical protein
MSGRWRSSRGSRLREGLLFAALHTMSLATLTHTPSPTEFLNRILARPDWERPFVHAPGRLSGSGRDRA